MKWKKLRLNILHAPEEGEGCITPQALTRNPENGKSLHPDREGLALIVTMFNGNKPYMQKNRSPGSWEVRVMQGRTGWQLWDTPHRLWTLYGQPFTSIMWHCLSLGLEWKLTFSSPVATAEFSKFAGILSAALSQHHLSGFGIVQLEFHHLH